MVELAATLIVAFFFSLIGILISDLIWSFFSFLAKDYRERPKKPPCVDHDWMYDFNVWVLNGMTSQATPPASSASTSVGAHRLWLGAFIGWKI